MATYIEVHAELIDHPKTRRLARLLGIQRVHVVGHLVEFWKWVMAYAPNGDVSRFDAIDITEGACWEGDAETFLSALSNCGYGGAAGFVERRGDIVFVHDWHKYSGKIVLTRFVDSYRKKHGRGPSVGEIQTAGLYPPGMVPIGEAVIGTSAESGSAPVESETFRRNPSESARVRKTPPDSDVEERSVDKRSVPSASHSPRVSAHEGEATTDTKTASSLASTRSEPSPADAELLPLYAAFRKAAIGPNCGDGTASEFRQARDALRELLQAGATPALMEKAVANAKQRWSRDATISVKSIAANWSSLLADPPAQVARSGEIARNGRDSPRTRISAHAEHVRSVNEQVVARAVAAGMCDPDPIPTGDSR